jgi:hypothetical protein
MHAGYRCAITAARSRAAIINNLARESLALVLRALFGAATSCVLVSLFIALLPVPLSHGPVRVVA